MTGDFRVTSDRFLGSQVTMDPAMLADGLTKLKGSHEALFRMLDRGLLKLVEETEHMEARSSAKNCGQDSQSIRKFGIKENLGSCEHVVAIPSTLDSKLATIDLARTQGPPSA